MLRLQSKFKVIYCGPLILPGGRRCVLTPHFAFNFVPYQNRFIASPQIKTGHSGFQSGRLLHVHISWDRHKSQWRHFSGGIECQECPTGSLDRRSSLGGFGISNNLKVVQHDLKFIFSFTFDFSRFHFAISQPRLI